MATAFRHALSHPHGRRGRAGRATGPVARAHRRSAIRASAERPVVVAGSGVWWDDAARELRIFADNGRLPAFLNGSGRGALPPEYELLFQHARRAALAEADLVCVVGAPLDFRLGFGRFAAGAKVVHVHADATQIGRNRHADVGVVGHCAAVLGILANGVRNPRSPREPWLERLRAAEREAVDALRARVEPDAAPIDHYRLGAELDRILDPGTIVIGVGGDVVAAVSRVLRVHRPGHWLDPGPFGCLGVGPP